MTRNLKVISANRAKKDTLSIIDAGLEAALPLDKIKKIIKNNRIQIPGKKFDLSKYDKVLVIAMGKASCLMVQSVDSLITVDNGIVIIPKKTKCDLNAKFKVIKAGHPVLDKGSIIAAKKILDFLHQINSNDFVIFLISGGSSSLVELPDGITLKEERILNDKLLRCEATIQEINCVRKHLSSIKGGKLLEHLRSDAVALVMSDVVGDDLSSIASGITYWDNTRFLDAKKILQKYNLEAYIPKNILNHINLGLEGKIPETPKKEKIKNYIIATNKNCLAAMRARARALGYSTTVQSCISGNVKDVSKKLVKSFTGGKMDCIVFGGETTVTVKGKGKGGRNQELVSYIALELHKLGKKGIVASVGTDGIDGNTDSAGAILQSDKEIGTIQTYLDNNDSYNFFRKYGGLIKTGPTGTNLMDVGLVLRDR